MFCNNCGQELKDGAKFCPKCGQSQRAVESTPADSPQASAPIQPAAKKQKLSVLTIVSAVLFIISALLINPFGLVSIAGLVCAIVDLVQKNKRGERQGRTLAIVLIICNCLSLIWFVVQFCLILGKL